MISLYIHIPFCKRKCKYCSFYSVCGERSSYLSALLKYIRYYGTTIKEPVDTVYIGGGTPSLLSGEQLRKILFSVEENFELLPSAEVTVECNPESVTKDFLFGAKSGGVNRISLGVQSFNDKELSAVGRLHDSALAKKAIETIKDCGFDNISCDLIFGLPYQTVQSLENSMETLVKYGAAHISCYNLQVEEGTALYNEKLPCASEEVQEQMYYKMCSFLEDNGYRHYEISNFAKAGFESRHNSGYWTGKDYLGLGPSAHSKLGNMRMSFDADVEKFINKDGFDFDQKQKIDDPFFEKIMLSLRTDKGIETNLLPSSKKYIDSLCRGGFAYIKDGRLALTDKGFYLSNTIISDIIVKEC